MARPNYPTTHSEERSQQRERGRNTQDIIKEIGKLKNLDELDIEHIAMENGIAESFVQGLGEKLNTTQLRKFFDKIIRIQNQIRNQDQIQKNREAVRADFYMIRPSLAYAKGRKLIPNEFFELVDTCMKKIPAENDEQTIKNYNRFVDLMKAIVAYAKYHGK